MLRVFSALTVCAALLLPLAGQAQVAPVPQQMAFQGRLARPDGTPVPDGNYSITFRLFDAASGGTQTFTQTVANVPVRNGIIAILIGLLVPADLAADRWAEIQIGSDPPLSPRQKLVSVPYAFKAGSVVDGSIVNASLANGSVTGAKIASGSLTPANFPPNFFNPLAWLLQGNSGTNPVTDFLGTTDNQPLIVRVNNQRAMRWADAVNTAANYRSINTLGGAGINGFGGLAIVGATIAGGGWDSTLAMGADFPNTVTAGFGTISGGYGNAVSGQSGTIAGGNSNTASGDSAAIGGGSSNDATAEAATVGGGVFNEATATHATVAGGRNNHADGDYAFVGGGNSNFATENYSAVGGGSSNDANAQFAFIGGGQSHTLTGTHGTIGGGGFNTVSGLYGTVPGGNANAVTGSYGFAAGRRAKSNHNGALVWADSGNADFTSTAANEFNVRASGGIRMFTDSTLTAGVTLLAGDSTWNAVSDRNAKTNFQPVDPLDILNKLAALPLTTWNYKTRQDIRHIGVMAQDFWAAFGGLGADDKHISTVDADGVAFAAIQGLYRKIQAVEAENAALRNKNAELENRLASETIRLQAELDTIKIALQQLLNSERHF